MSPLDTVIVADFEIHTRTKANGENLIIVTKERGHAVTRLNIIVNVLLLFPCRIVHYIPNLESRLHPRRKSKAFLKGQNLCIRATLISIFERPKKWTHAPRVLLHCRKVTCEVVGVRLLLYVFVS